MLTIDDTRTRDMDDAIEVVYEAASWVVRVAISDVSRVVKPGSPDDVAARKRGTTLYYATGNSPMLGRNLSDWTLSLVPGHERSALIVEMTLDPEAKLLKTTLKAGRIKSKAKLAYDEIPNILSDGEHDHNQELAHARGLAYLLLARRRATGAMVMYDLNNGWVTNEDGSLKKLDSKDDTIGYIIIQELMILTNTAVATYAIEHDIPLIYRNHLARAAVDRAALMQQIQEAVVTPLVDLRTLQHRTHLLLERARYEPVVQGHFGLNLPAYLHFTSPIRRYPDLVNHQQLRAHLKKQPLPYTQEELGTIATEMNTISANAREETHNFFKGKAENKARRQIDARLLDGLTPKDFERALKVEIRSGEPPSEAMLEAWIRRLDQGTVPPLCMTELLMHLSGPEEWRVLQEATVEALEERPEDAVTVLTQAATLGWPTFEHSGSQEGPPHAPIFTAKASLRLDIRDATYTATVVVENGSAKVAKQMAAVRLLHLIIENQDNVSHTTLKLESKGGAAKPPKPAVQVAKKLAIDPNKNPVSTLMEISQAEKSPRPISRSRRAGLRMPPSSAAWQASSTSASR